MPEERKKVWVDVFQTRLLWRTFAYWLFYTVAMWNLLFVWHLLREGPGNPLEQYVSFFADFYPALVVFALVFPVLAYDAIKFTHRLVGPLYRFRRIMQEVADENPVRPLKLREGDFLGEMRDDLNRMLESLQRRGVPVLKPADSEEEDRAQRRTA